MNSHGWHHPYQKHIVLSVRKPSRLMGLENHKCLLIISLTVLKMVAKTKRRNQQLIPLNESSSIPWMGRLAWVRRHLPLNQAEQVCRAEIYQALHVAHSNYSFASTQGDSKRFKLMFPNCPIAQDYSQADAKVKYNLQFGIAPYCTEQHQETPFFLQV